MKKVIYLEKSKKEYIGVLYMMLCIYIHKYIIIRFHSLYYYLHFVFMIFYFVTRKLR